MRAAQKIKKKRGRKTEHSLFYEEFLDKLKNECCDKKRLLTAPDESYYTCGSHEWEVVLCVNCGKVHKIQRCETFPTMATGMSDANFKLRKL